MIAYPSTTLPETEKLPHVQIASSVRSSRPALRIGHYLVVLVAGSCVYLANLGGPSLWDIDEGKNATAAIEMLESGDFIVPTFNGELRADKPVLLYWCQALCYQLFGVSEFAARLPSALAALATMLVCWEFGRSMFGPGAGLLAAFLAGTTAFMLGSGHFANPDALLNFFVASALTLFWIGRDNPTSAWFAGIGALLGLAVLTKGPVGFLLPALIMSSFLVWQRQIGVLWNRRVWHGVGAFLLVALPWYVAVTIQTHGDFLRGFLNHHNVRRFLSPLDQHDGPPVYHLLVLVAGLTPWSVFFVLAVSHWAVNLPAGFSLPSKRRLKPATTSMADAVRKWDRGSLAQAHGFLALWIATYVVFFSLAATKLPNYILPVAAPAGVWTAAFLESCRRGQTTPARWVMALAFASVAVIAIAIFVVLSDVTVTLPTSFRVQADNLGLEVRPWRWVTLIAAGASGCAIACWLRGYRTAALGSSLGGCLVSICLLGAGAGPQWNQIKAAEPLCEVMDGATRARDIRIGAFHLEHLPSLNFYARRNVTHFTSAEGALAFLRYQVPVFLFLPKARWDAMESKAPPGVQIIGRHPDFYRSSTVLVVTNTPTE